MKVNASKILKLNFEHPNYEEYSIIRYLILSENENENIIALQRLNKDIFKSIILENTAPYDTFLIYKYLGLLSEISKLNGSMNENLEKYLDILKIILEIIPDDTYNSPRQKIIKYFIMVHSDHWMLEYLLSIINKDFLYDPNILFNIMLKRNENDSPRIITRIMKFFILYGKEFNIKNVPIINVDMQIFNKFKETNMLIGLD